MFAAPFADAAGPLALAGPAQFGGPLGPAQFGPGPAQFGPGPAQFGPGPVGPLAAAGPGCAPCAIAAPPMALPGQNQQFAYNLPPQFRAAADCQTRVSQQLQDNNNHIFVTQPVINERNHHVNHLQRTLIRDNNFHHYRVNNLFRDNVINHHYNQVFRQQRHFCDYSCSQAVVKGTCTATPPVNTYHVLPEAAPCAAPAPLALAAPAPLALAGPGPACGSCAGGPAW